MIKNIIFIIFLFCSSCSQDEQTNDLEVLIKKGWLPSWTNNGSMLTSHKHDLNINTSYSIFKYDENSFKDIQKWVKNNSAKLTDVEIRLLRENYTNPTEGKLYLVEGYIVILNSLKKELEILGSKAHGGKSRYLIALKKASAQIGGDRKIIESR